MSISDANERLLKTVLGGNSVEQMTAKIVRRYGADVPVEKQYLRGGEDLVLLARIAELTEALRAAAPSGDEVEAALRAFNESVFNPGIGLVPDPHENMRAALSAAARVRAGREGGEWHRDDGQHSILLYTLKQDGWRKGDPVMVNDLMLRIEQTNGSSHDLSRLADAVLAALSTQEGK